MAYSGALVDRARVIRKVSAGHRVEGTTVLTPQTGSWFRARLGSSPAPQTPVDAASTHTTNESSLLVGLKDSDGNPLDISAVDQIEVDSKQLGRALWTVTGSPKPLRKKRSLIGYRVAVRKVDENDGTAVL